jgi:putative sterol carrier protein
MELWDDVVLPRLADPGSFHYVAEFGENDTGSTAQFKADHGKLLQFEPGKAYSEDECHFIFAAPREIWKQIATGKLDPVAAVASKRLHMRKGPMTIVIKEATAFKQFLISWGNIATVW